MKALFILASCVSLQSCVLYPLMHYSVAQNVPLISEKGEGQVSVSTGTELLGYQGAYGITNSITLVGSYCHAMNDIFEDGDMLGIYSHNGNRESGELAVGYHHLISPNVLFEIYGGAERYSRSYSFYTIYPPFTDNFSTNITKPFIQLDLGFLNNKKNGLGLSCKFGDFIFDHYSDKHTGTFPDPNNSNHIPDYYPLDNSSQATVEPCITYRAGGKNIICQLQLGTTFSPYSSSLAINDVFVSVGIQARFDFLKKKEPEE